MYKIATPELMANGKDYFIRCTDDKSGNQINIVVFEGDCVALRKQSGCDLKTIAQNALRCALTKGINKGEVNVKDVYLDITKSLRKT